jgi:hypothetical protein
MQLTKQNSAVHGGSIKLDEFFRGLFAALGSSGTEQIITHLDEHHESFQRVADKLERVHDECPEMPGTFSSSDQSRAGTAPSGSGISLQSVFTAPRDHGNGSTGTATTRIRINYR